MEIEIDEQPWENDAFYRWGFSSGIHRTQRRADNVNAHIRLHTVRRMNPLRLT